MYVNTDRVVQKKGKKGLSAADGIVQKLCKVKKKTFLGPCEGRTHDLGVISTTLCRLS